MSVAVLIPTVGGRDEMLDRVRAAYFQQAPDFYVLTVGGYSWGEGLNVLARNAPGDYWFCGCDDVLPHEGWFGAARRMVDDGLTPATRYFDVAGEPLRPGTDDAPGGTPIAWCRSFLLTPAIYAEVGPFLDATWWADIDYSERLAASGRPVTACDGFSFTHLDGPRDWLTVEEHDRQRALYEARPAGRASAAEW